MDFVDWGTIDYSVAVDRQLAEVERVANGGEETVIFCNHPPVVTVGRATTAEDIFDWNGARVVTSRGGRATYHGPSQLVIYPILDLRRSRPQLPREDVPACLKFLEGTTVDLLHHLGLTNAATRVAPSGDLSLTGVWVGDRKIASVGIAVRKWISYHGVAINVLEDPQAFHGIRPCGFQPGVMTSLERELGRPVPLAEVQGKAQSLFSTLADS